MESRIYRELYESYQHLYDLNESVEEQEIIIGYLLDEGFTDSVEGAMVIMESMSNQWYEIILEDISNLSKMSPSRIKSLRQTLEREINKLVNQIMQTKDPAQKEKLGKKARSLREKLNAAKKAESFHKFLKSDDSDEGLTPEQARKRRAVSSATRGRVSQSTKKGLPKPSDVRVNTSASDEEATKLTGLPVGQKFYNRSTGRWETVNSARPAQKTYGKNRRASYGQGSNSSIDTQGATPAGSTEDTTRGRLRGTGRSPG